MISGQLIRERVRTLSAKQANLIRDRSISSKNITITVLLLPPRAFSKSLVRTESLYGTLTPFLPSLCSAKAWITLPKEDKLRLMAAPSFSRSPVAPVDSTRSL